MEQAGARFFHENVLNPRPYPKAHKGAHRCVLKPTSGLVLAETESPGFRLWPRHIARRQKAGGNEHTTELIHVNTERITHSQTQTHYSHSTAIYKTVTPASYLAGRLVETGIFLCWLFYQTITRIISCFYAKRLKSLTRYHKYLYNILEENNLLKQ